MKNYLSAQIFVGMPFAKQEAFLNGAKEYTANDVVCSVCSFLNVSYEEITSPQRKMHIKEARHIAIYLIREMVAGITLQQIGKQFNRDHSTILSSIEVVKNGMTFDRKYKRKVETIKSNL